MIEQLREAGRRYLVIDDDTRARIMLGDNIELSQDTGGRVDRIILTREEIIELAELLKEVE